MIQLIHGDCREELKKLDNNSVDSIVTDPPYGISFMNKKWDYNVPSVEVWKECLRVLKSGGYLLSFAGTRTQHRMAVNIEDAGFEIRDMIAWVYGSGFPKSLDISKAIDKQAGAKREIIGRKTGRSASPVSDMRGGKMHAGGPKAGEFDASAITAPATDEAKQWDGWGTALKPAMEMITMARKPLSEKTVAENVLKWGTGGINIDGCRVEGEKRDPAFKNGRPSSMFQAGNSGVCDIKGRFPANLIHDGSDEVEACFPYTKSGNNCFKQSSSKEKNGNQGSAYGAESRPDGTEMISYGDNGSAARFFYCAKASKEDRGKGNNHPTVKPTDLMRYLVRLVTPERGICLDPYMGSGTTGKGCKLENFSFIGIEDVKESFDIAKKRIDAELYQTVLF